MATGEGILGNGSNFDERYIQDDEQLSAQIAALRLLKQRIVLTMGSFDFLHEGHYTYLEKAKQHGNILVVGLDSDEKIRARKGEGRPLLRERERLGQLVHSRYVDLVTVKQQDDAKWHLIKTVAPDVLIATEETYTAEQIADLQDNYGVGKVEVLPYTKTVSTTSKVRDLLLKSSANLAPALIQAMMARLPEFLSEHHDEIVTAALEQISKMDTPDTPERGQS